MKILVTGGIGFIGSHVCDNLLSKGITPVIFDHRQPEKIPDGCEFFLGSTTDYRAVSEAIAITNGVIHLAGVLGTQETITEPIPAIETNVIGGVNVFKAIKHYNKKAVYIAVGNHWMNNSYSITKTTAERFAFMFNKEMGTKIAIVRGLNAYGPRQKQLPVKKIIPNFIVPTLFDQPIEVYGDGSQIMDMIYVKDLAEILVSALLVNHEVYDKAFEAGTGRRTTVREIAEEVIKQIGKGDINYSPMRPGEPEHSIVIGDPETLKPLGDIKMTSLEDGLKETIQWYKELHQL